MRDSTRDARPRRPLTALLLLCAVAAAAEEITPIAKLMGSPDAFDGKRFCIAGKASEPFTKYSRHGNHYFTTWLSEGEAKVKVFGFGSPNFAGGEVIEACGLFTRVKKVSNRVFYDEFSASAVLKGKAMRAGLVEVTPQGVFPAKGKTAP